MKDIRRIHRDAISLAKEANDALLSGASDEFLRLTNKAFDLEVEAAMELVTEFEAEPTRSVLFRSAASLAFNIGNFAAAKKLIHLALAGNPFEEIKIELEELYDKIKEAIASETSVSEATENFYLTLLRSKAFNAKVEPKEPKYSRAIVIDHIVDYLKNLQNSFTNYCEVSFRRFFSPVDFSDYEKSVQTFKRDSKILCVNTVFKSFGVSISADTEIMNFTDYNSEKFSEFKKTLFEEFKKEVIMPDFNSFEFQENIQNKYTAQERLQIYTPILDSLDAKCKYNVSIADHAFKSIIKKCTPVSQKTASILKPKLEAASIPDEEMMLLRTYELTDSLGKKKAKLVSDQLSYAEISANVKNLNYLKKNAYFVNPYEFKIIFDHGTFIVNDNKFDLYVESKEYKDIFTNISKEIIEKFTTLLSKNPKDLNKNEADILEALKNNVLISF